MSQFKIRLVLVIGLLASLALQAESPASLYKKGQDAEAAQMYEAAYEFYKQAYDKNPKDLRYRVAFERTRFYAAAAKVHRGQLFRDGGRLEEALEQFEAAAAIDPSMDIAQQEIRTTQRMMEQLKQPSPSSSEQDEVQSQGEISKELRRAQGPIALKAISDQPILLNLTEDSRMIYETVGKLAGINVLFDPDYASRRIHIDLNGVSLQDALQIIAFESKTFWRPVTSNTIFVAQDNPNKRKELEQNVIKTFYLSNVSQQSEFNDIVAGLRSLLQIERVQPMISKSAIAVRGTPDQIVLAEKLIDDFDKAEPEVVVDVAIMQVNRDHTRNLGIAPVPIPNTPGGIATVGLAGSPAPAPAGGGGGGNSPASGGGGITFNTLKHLGSQSYSVSLPGALVSFLFSDSDSKVIQSPQLRSVNGIKATLKIGDRVPVATGSFANPLSGGSGINPVVQTQFNYQEVGVKIEITPTVHANHEINLKVAMEISSITGKTTIGNIDEPNIGQRTVENEIRLKEGEINIMGGIFEDSDVKGWSGLPGLGKIPLFRHLFASENIQHSVNEIVFVLIPHIVRKQEITPLNTESIDTGGNTIQLRLGPEQKQTTTSPQAEQEHR